MAYKQKSEDLKSIMHSMRNKASYRPGDGDPPEKTTTKKGDATEGMSKLEEAYYQKQIGSKKLDAEGKYLDEEGNWRDGKTDKILPIEGIKDERAIKQYLAVQSKAKP